MSKWSNNAIQFPRLLAEIMATQNLDLKALAESMDLSVDQVNELFDRADASWENIKAGNVPLDPQMATEALLEIESMLATHPEAKEGNSKVHYCLCKARVAKRGCS